MKTTESDPENIYLKQLFENTSNHSKLNQITTIVKKIIDQSVTDVEKNTLKNNLELLVTSWPFQIHNVNKKIGNLNLVDEILNEKHTKNSRA